METGRHPHDELHMAAQYIDVALVCMYDGNDHRLPLHYHIG